MTLTELRKLVNDSTNRQQLLDLTVTVNYPKIKFTLELKGIVNIYQFVLNQVKGWNKLENLPEILLHSKYHFEDLKNMLEASFQHVENWNVFNNSWNTIYTHLTSDKTSTRHSRHYYVFIYNCPEVHFLYSLSVSNNNNYEEIRGAYHYIIGTTDSIATEYLTGILKGYEFINKDVELLQRRDAEKKSLVEIREQFGEYIVEAESQLNQYLQDTKENLIHHFDENDK